MTKIKIIHEEKVRASLGTDWPIKLGAQVIGSGKILGIDGAAMILEVEQGVADEFYRLTKTEPPKHETRDGSSPMDSFYLAK